MLKYTLLMIVRGLSMNSRCPFCNHRFRLKERRRFVTWRFSRRMLPCPDCGTSLLWERKAHRRFVAGLWLTAIFDGIFLGIGCAPQIGMLLGFVDPQSVDDPYWHSLFVRCFEIIALVLTLASLTLMFSGFAKYRLIPSETIPR